MGGFKVGSGFWAKGSGLGLSAGWVVLGLLVGSGFGLVWSRWLGFGFGTWFLGVCWYGVARCRFLWERAFLPFCRCSLWC